MNLKLGRNSFWAIAEVIIVSLSLFVLYKIVILFLGPKGLGVWSLVLATTSIARLGDIGTAAGLARFVATALARGDEKQAGNYVDTAVLSNLALYGVLGTVLYLPLRYGLSLAVPESALAEACSLLPYAILSLVFLNLNAVMLSALVGGRRYDLKSKIVIVSTFVQIAAVGAGISSLGLIAMAWGQIAQYFVSAVVARILFVRLIPEGEIGFLPLLLCRNFQGTAGARFETPSRQSYRSCIRAGYEIRYFFDCRARNIGHIRVGVSHGASGPERSRCANPGAGACLRPSRQD